MLLFFRAQNGSSLIYSQHIRDILTIRSEKHRLSPMTDSNTVFAFFTEEAENFGTVLKHFACAVEEFTRMILP